MDPTSGLVYMQQRYYDPATGRFISPDPVAPSPGNLFNFGRYTYANDNPTVNIDPTGAYMCDPGSKKRAACDDVKKGYGDLQRAIGNPHLGSRAHARLVAIANKIGKPGTKNGVVIYTSGHTIVGDGVLGGAQIRNGTNIIGVDVTKIHSADTANGEHPMSDSRFDKYLAGTIAHEGSHLLDELGHPGGYPTGLFTEDDTEIRAYTAEAWTYEGLGVPDVLLTNYTGGVAFGAVRAAALRSTQVWCGTPGSGGCNGYFNSSPKF